ncbi:hypothetical protein NL676_032170 [Syzygium grande]|nr:hypothetical protein NL676_032170 [Syzygium grande]
MEDEEARCCCFGLYKDRQLNKFPFPQNKDLTVRYTGPSTKVNKDEVFLIPVVDLPLSCNQYYVIQRRGKHKGYVCDLPGRDYEQVQRLQRKVHWYTKRFLKRKGWALHGKTPKNFSLDNDALGVNDSPRSKLPSLDVPIDQKSLDPVVVGKWCCPFMFVKDGKAGDQIKASAFCEMTLQQRWEQVHACDNYANEGNDVEVDVLIQKEAVRVFGEEAGEGNVNDGVMWLSGRTGVIGLSMAIVGRMRWEEERVGWVEEVEKRVRVKRVEEFIQSGLSQGWKRFGFYVLVESFVLKRMDGTLVLAYDFKHPHQVRTQWE